MVRPVFWALLIFGWFATVAGLKATPILKDRGIYLAGPFAEPDITKPPSASAEAVFVAGAHRAAPFFLNDLVIATPGRDGDFSNNGWVNGSAFSVAVSRTADVCWLTWNLRGTGYALTDISVNFDNIFYHLYGTQPSFRSTGVVEVTGNMLDPISHIHFFGIRTVPEGGTTGALLVLALAFVTLLRPGARRRGAQQATLQGVFRDSLTCNDAELF
jgi:hypothetical protein